MIRFTLCVIRLVACLVLSALIYLSLASTLVNDVAGSPSAFSSLTVSVTSSPAVRASFAAHVVDTITIAADQVPSSREYYALVHSRHAYITALTATLATPAVTSAESTIARQLYHAVRASRPTTLNLAPVIDPLTATLHSINPVIPLNPPGLGSLTSTFSPTPASHALNAIAPTRHYLLLATLIVALAIILITRIRLLSVILTAALPLIVFYSLSYGSTLVSPNFHFGAPLTHSIISAIMVHVGNIGVHVSILALIPAAAVVLAAFFARHGSLFLARSRARKSMPRV